MCEVGLVPVTYLVTDVRDRKFCRIQQVSGQGHFLLLDVVADSAPYNEQGPQLALAFIAAVGFPIQQRGSAAKQLIGLLRCGNP